MRYSTEMLFSARGWVKRVVFAAEKNRDSAGYLERVGNEKSSDNDVTDCV